MLSKSFSNRCDKAWLPSLAATALLASATVGQAIAGPTAQTGPTGFHVGIHFQTYYKAHDGLRLLGYAVSDESLLEDNGSAQTRRNIPVQYFQKGRIEYQGNMGLTGQWEYSFGLLVPEMLEQVTEASDLGISNTGITYMQLKTLIDRARIDAAIASRTGGHKTGTSAAADP